MGYKVIHRMPIKNNTLVTVEGQIKPIKIGDSVNGGKSTLLSVGLSDAKENDDNRSMISLLLSGKFEDEEIVY